MKKLIFVAGPVRGDGSKEAKQKNIEIAKKFILVLIANNIPYYSPHLNIDQEIISLGEEASKLAWDMNAEFLRRCDGLAVLPGWETSSGTKMEIENATKLSLPVFYLEKESAIGDILDWIKN